MKRFLPLLFILSLAAFPAGAEVYQKIVAKVGTDIITSYDIDEALEFLKAQMGAEELASSEGRQKLEAARKTQLEGLIQQRLVIQSARKWDDENKDKGEGKALARANPNLPRPEEVDEAADREFDRIEGAYSSREAFRRELEGERLSEEAFKARLREKVLALLTYQRVVKNKEKEFQGSFAVSDAETRKYYQDHKEEFATGDQVMLRDLTLPDDSKSLEKIKELKKRIEAGEDFAALAKRYSKDEAASKGGMLGWIEKGQLKWPALEEAAFKAKVGQVAGPVKTSRGWHLILVEDTRQESQKDYEQVQSQVKNVLYGQKMKERIEDWVKELRAKTYVEILP